MEYFSFSTRFHFNPWIDKVDRTESEWNFPPLIVEIDDIPGKVLFHLDYNRWNCCDSLVVVGNAAWGNRFNPTRSRQGARTIRCKYGCSRRRVCRPRNDTSARCAWTALCTRGPRRNWRPTCASGASTSISITCPPSTPYRWTCTGRLTGRRRGTRTFWSVSLHFA